MAWHAGGAGGGDLQLKVIGKSSGKPIINGISMGMGIL